MNRRVLVSLAVALTLTAKQSAAVDAPRTETKLPHVETDWCTGAVDTLDEETCVVIPDGPATVLLVYFHGIVPPSKESRQKTNYQTVVANAARRAHVVALLPRGRKGFAPAGNPGWWGWPTTEASYQAHAKELVDSVLEKRTKLEALLGKSFTKTFVAGSSSGAYFVAALALHGGMEADGFAVISGGAGKATPELARLTPKPFYVGYGRYDTVGRSAWALSEVMRRARWPVLVAEAPYGHGAREIYLDQAFEFFLATRGWGAAHGTVSGGG